MRLTHWLSIFGGDSIRRRAQPCPQRRRNASLHRHESACASIESLEQRTLLTAPNPVDLGTLDAGNASVPDGFRLEGAVRNDQAGTSVSGAGDVNGDGFEDYVIGAPTNGGEGSAYVVFGKSGGFAATQSLADLDGTDGFQLVGIGAVDQVGKAVSGVGDFNGDGFADLVVATYRASSEAGSAWVVFGKASFGASIDLSTLDGTNGFRLNGLAQEQAGQAVASAGDVNGDGFGDLIIGAPSQAIYAEGAAYVVFGKDSGFSAEMSLGALNGTDGFKLFSNVTGYAGEVVSGAGDINGDGFDDVIVASGYEAAYIVFGHGGAFGATFDLTAITSATGFVISGDAYVGKSVSELGDVNGDGFDDLIAAAYSYDTNSYAGEAYVIFGGPNPTSVNVSSLTGTNGFTILGVGAYDYLGAAVSAAGDINGDGLDDILIGADRADYTAGSSGSGRAYVVFGRSDGFTASINLDVPNDLDGIRGFRLDGQSAYDYAGGTLSSAGDVNGDGFDDLIIGARGVNVGIEDDAGASYVVFGSAFNAGSETQIGTAASNTLNASQGTGAIDRLIGGQGNDNLNADGGSDVLIGGQGDDVLGIATGNLGAKFRIDGGTGIDTLKLGGSAGFTGNLDLTATPDGRIVDIERIDLRGSGANTLTLDVLEVLGISDTSNELTVRRDAADTVNVGAGWTDAGKTSVDGVSYQVLTQGEARLLVESLVSLTVSPASVAEGSGGGLVYTFTRTDTTGNVTVNFNVAGSATHTLDYTAAGAASFNGSNGTVTIADGFASATVTLSEVNDTLVEGDENVTLTLVSATGYGIGSPSSATGAIVDNDTAVLRFDSATSSAGEETGTHNVIVRLTVTANDVAGTGTIASPVTITIDDLTNGSAGGVDYTFVDPTSLTFNAGAATSTKSASITLLNDTVVESDETINLKLAALSDTLDGQVSIDAANDDHTATIDDNEIAVFAFNTATSNVSEFTSTSNLAVGLTITANGVANSGTLGESVTINVDQNGGTATSGTDYSFADPMTLAFNAGASSGAMNASIGLTNDTIVEGDETVSFVVNALSSTLNGNVSINISANSHLLTINDNDTAEFAFDASASNSSETAGTHNVAVNLTITANGVADSGTLGSQVTVAVARNGGSATQGSDDTFSAPVTLTFNAGASSGSVDAGIGLTNDTIVEGNETLGLALNGLSSTLNGTVSINSSLDDHSITIGDNDTAVFSFGAPTSNPSEAAGTHNVSVNLTITANGVADSGTLGSQLSINVARDGGSATAGTDDTFTSPVTVTFDAGAESGSMNAAIGLTNDTVVEGDEAINAALNGLSSTLDGAVSVNAEANSHVVTINDNDTAVFAFDVATSNPSESVGDHDVAVRLTITANGESGTGTLAAPLSVEVVNTGDGTAGAGDFSFTSPTQLTFSSASETRNVSLAIINDVVEESNETIELELNGLSSVVSGNASIDAANNTHVVTIGDNDADVPVSLQTELRIAHVATATDGNGEADALPDNAEFVDEWDEFFLEVWGKVANSAAGVETAHIEVPFQSDFFTVDTIEIGESFAAASSSNVDTETDDGRIFLELETARTDAGLNSFVLFARISLSVHVELANNLLDAYVSPTTDDRFDAENITATIDGGEAATPLDVANLTTDIWPVLYDVDDNGNIGFGDLPAIASVFGASTAANPTAFRVDFDGSGVVSFGDITLFASNLGRSKSSTGEQTYAPDFPAAWQSGLLASVASTESAEAYPLEASSVLMDGSPELESIKTSAINQFETAGLDASSAEELRSVDVVVRDLPGRQLGLAEGNRIIIDVDAAGAGWFVDSTPADGSELSDIGVANRFDLLTVIAHELGHVLGLRHDDDGGLMEHTLEAGVRREVATQDLDQLYAGFDGLDELL